MGIQGTGLRSSNARFRFFGFILITIVAFGVMLYWRQQTLKQSEYVSIPGAHNNQIKSELRSKNFQLDVQDSSPSVQ